MKNQSLIAGRVLGLTAALILVVVAAPLFGQPAAKKLGSEFQVNTATLSEQKEPAVGMDAAGNFVVVWQDYSSGTYIISGQRFDSLGAFQGGEIPLTSNAYPAGYPTVGMDGSGNFVVAWESFYRDGSVVSIFAKRFDASGNSLSGEFEVNTFTTGSQRRPAASADQSGNFVIVWQSLNQDGGSYGVFGQRFDDTGATQGGEFQVNTFTTFAQYQPRVAMDVDGDFVVVWQSLNQDGDSSGVFGQRFDAGGGFQGPELRVNTFTSSYQSLPDAGADDAGNFVVTWSSPQDGSNSAAMAQRVDSSGVKQGGEIQANTFVSNVQAFSSVGVSPAGDFAVAWSSFNQDGSGYGVFGQFFDSSGAPVGGEFHANSFTVGTQSNTRIGMDAAGNFVVAWESAYQDGSLRGIFAQRFLAPCREEMALGLNQWHTIALPCAPPAGADTVQAVFGDDLPAAGYGASWSIYRWDASVPQYVLVALTDTLDPAVGYFIKTTLPGRTIDVEGNNVDYSCTSASFSGVGGCYETAALSGAAGDCTDADYSDGRFNLVGFPFRMQVYLSGALYDDNGTERSTTTAETLGLASDNAWTWNGAAYQVGDSCTLGMEKTFSTWDAFWVNVCEDATPLSLRIPARSLDFACSAPPPPIGPEEEIAFDEASRQLRGPARRPESAPGGKPPKERAWYLRLIATSGALSDPGNVLGELEDSVLGYDSHDLVELVPFGTDWLTVVFPHTDWGADSSEWYTSDYHGLDDPREWSFEVRSSTPRTVTLTWELTGDPKLLRRMELVDEMTGATVPADEGSYTFTMAGTEHRFGWHKRRGGKGG